MFGGEKGAQQDEHIDEETWGNSDHEATEYSVRKGTLKKKLLSNSARKTEQVGCRLMPASRSWLWLIPADGRQ